MPRDLGEVLHWFLDDPAARPSPGAPARTGEVPPRTFLLGIASRDVLRAAFAWNLAAALAERSRDAVLVVPERDALASRRPGARGGRIRVTAPGLRALTAASHQEAERGVPVLVCLDPESLEARSTASPPARHALAFAAPDDVWSGRTLDQLSACAAAWPALELGAIVHGISRRALARQLFEELAGEVRARLGRELLSYGWLLDDLDVYRSVVEERPVIESRPGSRAALALRDVAGWLHGDGEARQG